MGTPEEQFHQTMDELNRTFLTWSDSLREWILEQNPEKTPHSLMIKGKISHYRYQKLISKDKEYMKKYKEQSTLIKNEEDSLILHWLTKTDVSIKEIAQNLNYAVRTIYRKIEIFILSGKLLKINGQYKLCE